MREPDRTHLRTTHFWIRNIKTNVQGKFLQEEKGSLLIMYRTALTSLAYRQELFCISIRCLQLREL